MKNILWGVIGFAIAATFYNGCNYAIDSLKYSAYVTGYEHGYKKKDAIERDSLDMEIERHNKWLDSMKVEICKSR